MERHGEGHGPARTPPPTPDSVAWLRDEAGLRPPSIARLLGLAPDTYAAWCAGRPGAPPADVPLLAAVDALYRRVCTRLPDRRARCRWWTDAQREVGWLSPAEMLRRGKLGEVFLLAAATAGRDPRDDQGS